MDLLSKGGAHSHLPLSLCLQALPADLLQKLTSDPDLLLNVLNYHVIPEELTCRELYNNRVLDTLNAQGKVRVNEYSSVSSAHAQRVLLGKQCSRTACTPR